MLQNYNDLLHQSELLYRPMLISKVLKSGLGALAQEIGMGIRKKRKGNTAKCMAEFTWKQP